MDLGLSGNAALVAASSAGLGRASAKALVEATVDEFGRLDNLVTNAGDHLRAGDGGTLVAITSKSVKEAVDRLVLSNALRTGVVGLVKTLSREWTPAVRANVVMPGSHETGRTERLVEADVERGVYDSRDEAEADWIGDVPLDRMGDPEYFGRVVALLSSEPASYVNGAALMVDGGASRSIL